jgi:squalene synthase HpnC
VALRLLPRRLRRDLMALYGFARLVDDLGDGADEGRLAALAEAERELALAYAGRATHPLLRALEPVLREHHLPPAPFLRLIDAGRREEDGIRIGTRADLMELCALSANPVGELVLRVLGRATPENVALSDALCSGLQLVEHVQDATEDAARGRTYLPAEDLARSGCAPSDLGRAPTPEPVRCLLAYEAERARELLRAGAALLPRLSGAGRLAVTGFAAGGLAALRALERANFDVAAGAPRPRRRDVVLAGLRLLLFPPPGEDA